jgi:hypothetical protein
LALGLLGGLGVVGEVRAAPRLPPLPLLEFTLFELQSADQTAPVQQAAKDVAAAIVALGGVAPMRTFSHPRGLFVLHNRHKLRRSLLAVKLVLRDLRGKPGNGPAKARSDLNAAVQSLETALLTPFLF